jgi:hypothetical protein
MECLLFDPTYIGEKRTTLGNTYGIKAMCYKTPPTPKAKDPFLS